MSLENKLHRKRNGERANITVLFFLLRKKLEGGEKMNKKALGIFVCLLVVAMLALPISAGFATKPETIEGTFTMLPTGPPPFPEASVRPCGKSDMAILTWTELAMNVEGDMEGTGVYSGRWICVWENDMPAEVRAGIGEYTLDVEIGELSGQLTIGINKGNMAIIGGTGDLANLHGTGSVSAAGPTVYAYSMNVHFDP
jgi:hypothetical protein